MIARLSGTVLEREAKALVVDVNGVGYRVRVLSSLLERSRRGEEMALRIYHHITDGAEELFGFAEREDLAFFELLLLVPSVGPRTAMNILDAAPPRVLEQAVAEEDITVLTKVSGVGRKTAERILVELKERVSVGAVSGAAGSVQQGAIEALVSLGYSTEQARAAVRQLPAQVATIEEAVRAVLQSQGAAAR